MNPLLLPVKLYGERYAWPKRRRVITQALLPFIDRPASILDIGCGDARLSGDLAPYLPSGTILHGVDMLKQVSPPIPYIRYDGLHLPFPDRAYDVSLLIDVLHHSRDPAALLREAARVTRRCVIIKDHDYRSDLDLLLMKVGDYLGNKMFDIDLPYNFRTWDAFAAMFEEAGLKILALQDSLRPGGKLELHHHFIAKLAHKTPARNNLHDGEGR